MRPRTKHHSALSLRASQSATQTMAARSSFSAAWLFNWSHCDHWIDQGLACRVDRAREIRVAGHRVTGPSIHQSSSLVAQRGFTHPHRPVTLLHGFQALARKREGYYTRGAFMRRWSGKTLKPTNMLRGSFFYAHRKSMRGNSVEHVTRDNPSMQSAGVGALLNRTLGDRVGAQIHVALHRQRA